MRGAGHWELQAPQEFAQGLPGQREDLVPGGGQTRVAGTPEMEWRGDAAPEQAAGAAQAPPGSTRCQASQTLQRRPQVGEGTEQRGRGFRCFQRVQAGQAPTHCPHHIPRHRRAFQ